MCYSTPYPRPSIDSISQCNVHTLCLRIPSEMVALILTFLSTPDQICFSLSCKYVLNCFRSSLKAQGMQLAQLLPPEEHSIICPNVGTKPRIHLLRRLENDRWKYCCECWTLHPQSTLKTHQEPYCFQCQTIHGQNCSNHGICMAYAGEVDICPCLTV